MRKLCIHVAMAAIAGTVMAEGQTPLSDANIRQYGSLQNCRVRFEKEKKGHVAFIGGSITEMNGYRPMVMEILKKRFPDTAFTFTDAGSFNLLHRFSRGLHYPRTVVFAADLEEGEHEMTMRVSEKTRSATGGHAVRVLHFVAN